VGTVWVLGVDGEGRTFGHGFWGWLWMCAPVGGLDVVLFAIGVRFSSCP